MGLRVTPVGSGTNAPASSNDFVPRMMSRSFRGTLLFDASRRTSSLNARWGLRTTASPERIPNSIGEHTVRFEPSLEGATTLLVELRDAGKHTWESLASRRVSLPWAPMLPPACAQKTSLLKDVALEYCLQAFEGHRCQIILREAASNGVVPRMMPRGFRGTLLSDAS